MKYKLYTNKQYDSSIEQILCGRGMPQEQIEEWLNAGWSQINNWKAFGEKEMVKAVCMVENAIQNNENLAVIVDSDADGFTSAAIFINYLHKINPEYAVNHIFYKLHTGKQHGLTDMEIEDNIKLVVCPDSSSNDYEQIEELYNRGKEILILDHHEASHKARYARTINNQLCDYPNKNLSGAGIVWQWCRCYDEIFGYNYANDLLDLCALGNLSDMMNYQELETRAIIKLGLQDIHNPFFYYMCEHNKFSIDKMGGINYFSIAFYVTPFINAICRSGTMEEKELVFQSMLQQYAFKNVESGKRGCKGQLVPRVEEGVRIAANVKSRQGKLQDDAMGLFDKRIREQQLDKNPIILLLCEPGEVEPNIAGLCANKVQAKYQRPTLILTRTHDKDSKTYYYRGSGRNYSMSEVQNFRELCEQTQYVEYATGHEGAFGCSIAENEVEEFLDAIKAEYKDVPQEPVYYVDYIWNQNSASPQTILEIAGMRDFWSTGIAESKVCVENIPTDKCSIALLSADKNPTIKITLPNGVNIMKFKSNQEEYEQFLEPNSQLTLVGSPNRNEWNGNVTAQILIDDFELRKEWVF